MATIKITDSLQGELISANPQVNSGFGKYLKGIPADLLAGADFASQFTRPLATVNPGQSGFGLSFSHSVPLGDSQVELSIAASAKASIGVYNRTGMLLFEDTFIGAPQKVAGGQAFVAFSFHPSVAASLNQGMGEISFGFEAGTEAEFRCYRPFDVTAAPVTLGEACKTLFENFALPGTVDDLKAMGGLPAGTLAAVSGRSHLTVGASVDFAAAFNPLATLNTIPKVGKLTISGAASVTAGVQVKVAGDFQIRVETRNATTIRLSYHKMHSGELDFSLDAKAGPGLTLGDRDLLQMLFGGETGAAGTSEEDLVAAGIRSAQLAQIKAAMRAGMSRKLNLELAAQFSSLKQDEAAFAYDIDLTALDAAGEQAVNAALAGDLSGLNQLEPQMPAHGIRVLQSRFQALRQKQIQWRINLLGIVNVLSMRELARTATVFHDEESGELVIADEASTKRIGAITEARNVRKVLYESAVITATYKASGIDVNSSLKASQSFFLFDKHANRQRVSDFLDAVAAVGLMPAAEIPATLGSIDDFGKASLLLETEFDQDACQRLFLDGAAPRDADFYEQVGKLAVLALVEKTDPDAYRRIPMEDGNLWKKMKDAGQPGFPFILPASIAGGADATIRVARVRQDYSLIVWWAETMSKAAVRLAAVQALLKGRDPATLEQDKNFQDKRKALADELADAIQKNQSNFDDPWGLVALFMASKRSAAVSATLVSARLTLFLP